ncbi:hypothetical protein MUK42_13453 [Musa troglodytarum]|uniref:Uncharacterized protein n=1 Tax=Musa troglodytarum TaxID=320322 RepID=A0A9E7HE71_9LILI|nr:hypothetical protein MUK42_13453 [Musa troglodytarum]
MVVIVSSSILLQSHQKTITLYSRTVCTYFGVLMCRQGGFGARVSNFQNRSSMWLGLTQLVLVVSESTALGLASEKIEGGPERNQIQRASTN